MSVDAIRPVFEQASLSQALAIPSTEKVRRPASVFAFTLSWLFVGFVSAYDAFLIVRYQDVIHDSEMNPVGRYIMNLEYRVPISDTRGVAKFLGFKFAGTIIVLGVLTLLYLWSERIGLTIAGALTAFQACLAAFLLLA